MDLEGELLATEEGSEFERRSPVMYQCVKEPSACFKKIRVSDEANVFFNRSRQALDSGRCMHLLHHHQCNMTGISNTVCVQPEVCLRGCFLVRHMTGNGHDPIQSYPISTPKKKKTNRIRCLYIRSVRVIFLPTPLLTSQPSPRSVLQVQGLTMGSLIFLCFTLVLLYPYRTVSLGSSNAAAAAAATTTTTTTTQVLALLSFKSMVSDPSGLLASWNDSTHLCRWRGVGCGRKHPERVVELNLNSFGLSGRITPFLCNLSHLTVLDLAENQLVGQIPHELGHLGRLRVLNLTTNSLQGSIPATLAGCAELVELYLDSNLLQGKIPGEIGTLRNLVYLKLNTNDLSGEIPPSLGNLSMLAALGLANNTLSGEIPASFGNLSNLKILALWMNQLTGGIPSSLGRLSNLSQLDLEVNNLTGSIPHAIWNISSLIGIAVATNELTGTIPPNAFNTLPLLNILYLGSNLFHGYLPSSLANASNLSGFEIIYNYFSGVVPSELGGLQSLQWIILACNSFEAKESNDWKFITSLTNCSQLQGLELDFNRFSGMLPSAISNLSTSLTFLSLSNNEISGNIPREIGNLGNLQSLQLNNNFLAGTIPSSFSMLRNLQALSLQNNSLSGPIPSTIGNLTKLNSLDLAMNAFSGIIPNTLGNMLSLLRLDLSTNNFTGMIPSSLFNITTLSIYLDISNNHLEGPIPLEVGNLQNLVEFDALFNRLSGEIPITLGKCQLLQKLRLQNNSFSGNIPSLLSGLKGLEILDLSNNNFSGQIPEFLGDLHTLSDLNLSFNNFDGEVPTVGIFANATGISVQGNGELCGGIQDLHLPPCSLQISKKRHKFPMLAFVVSLVATTVCILLLFLFFLTFHKKRSRESPSTMSMTGHQLVSYQQLTHATDGFSTTNLLGNGSYGSVYRGKLYDETGENENLVAVKVLKLQAPGALKSFTAECEAMRNLRHRNLVKIITACSSIDFNGNEFKAIVFDFMPNGSLEEWLHPNTNNQREERHLSLVQRVSILFDVACALDYLHFHGAAPVVHCDLKPSNVLLDADMVAHVGDFGLAKILAEGCSSFQPSMSSLGFRGTIGYAPPEYGAGNMVSTRGDIYSYGVLILEMVTGKRPTDNTFEQGLSLRKYVEMALTSGVMDIIDMELVTELENGPATVDGPSNRRRFDSLISLLKLGMFCSEEMPSSRMSTKDIVKDLLAIKTALV